MRPAAHHLQSVCPDAPEELVREHLKRLDDEYFERFELDDVVDHLRGLAGLSTERPVEVLVDRHSGSQIGITVLAFDYPSLFSLITGVLCGMGAGIASGDVFTYAKALARSEPGSKRSVGSLRLKKAAGFRRRRIVDHFWCSLAQGEATEEWIDELRRRLREALGLLESGGRDGEAEAKARVNELVTSRLVDIKLDELPALLPVDVDFDNDSGPFTRLTVTAQDTPAFLYSFSSALALQDCSIERVRIRTAHGNIRDEIDFVDDHGRPVRDPEAQDRIRLCALLTKQFTYFLDKAPDPFSALSRFEQLVEQLLEIPENEAWVGGLSNPRLMEDLARLLGASDYLWEDFIRLQYEALLPILAPHTQRGDRISTPSEDLSTRCRASLDGAESYTELCDRLNAFKDREIFLIDLDHILDDRVDFRTLSTRLTALAEVVVRHAAEIVFDELVAKYGRPRTAGGLEAAHAIFGLGKLGGCALGYASDIELLVVYGDNGKTDGTGLREEPLDNSELFSKLATELAKAIRAKREGIFEVDLRLRPYGAAGLMASSLEQFCTYYGPEGGAHSAERLALVRLRAVAGDEELGRQVERLRDQYLYFSRTVDIGELQTLRARQFDEKRKPGVENAKFSVGALVDLEYTVQVLQVFHGQKSQRLRTSSIRRALEVLEEIGVVEPDESGRLLRAYDFLRRLINGLRMLRGSAKDLQLPAVDSGEFLHLARRMDYTRTADLGPGEQLHLDFETCTAAVRTFVARRLGRDSLPGPLGGNAADLILADEPRAELRQTILGGLGFRDPERAYRNLRRLAGTGEQREVFSGLAVLACDRLRFEPDPDMALNSWERFLSARGGETEHYRHLLSQPKRLGILVGVLSRSQFLADTLIRDPDFFDWITEPSNLERIRRRAEFERELRSLAKASPDHEKWLETLRVFRRREMLRIGVRDMCLRVATEEVVEELSTLAEAIVHVALQEAWRRLGEANEIPPGGEDLPHRFCILAFGKLGGKELNYSSDIDLLCVFDDSAAHVSAVAPAVRVVESLLSDLSTVTEDGSVYRVDLRLRPWGGVGEIVSSIDSIETYYREQARLWEIQALLKIRPIAGNQQVGYDFVERLRPLLVEPRDLVTVGDAIRRLRQEAVSRSSSGLLRAGIDVKNGRGGIRDVEFLVQGLQLVHASSHPELLLGNTLAGLAALARCELLPAEAVEDLRDDYIFLRRVEHYLQILHDRQTHTLPTGDEELEALARRVLGVGASAGVFREELESRLRRVHRSYERFLCDPGPSGSTG